MPARRKASLETLPDWRYHDEERIALPLVAILWSGCAATPDQQLAEEQTAEPEPVVVTLWSEKTELFVEFPPLIAGEPSRFAIHFTDLGDFQPLLKGTLRSGT